MVPATGAALTSISFLVSLFCCAAQYKLSCSSIYAVRSQQISTQRLRKHSFAFYHFPSLRPVFSCLLLLSITIRPLLLGLRYNLVTLSTPCALQRHVFPWMAQSSQQQILVTPNVQCELWASQSRTIPELACQTEKASADWSWCSI